MLRFVTPQAGEIFSNVLSDEESSRIRISVSCAERLSGIRLRTFSILVFMIVCNNQNQQLETFVIEWSRVRDFIVRRFVHGAFHLALPGPGHLSTSEGRHPDRPCNRVASNREFRGRFAGVGKSLVKIFPTSRTFVFIPAARIFSIMANSQIMAGCKALNRKVIDGQHCLFGKLAQVTVFSPVNRPFHLPILFAEFGLPT